MFNAISVKYVLIKFEEMIRHSFSTYVRVSGLRNFSFSENFVDIINKWSLLFNEPLNLRLILTMHKYMQIRKK